MHLPPPPSLKTTIIQLNKDIDPEDNNYEILNNVYNPSSSGRNLSTSSASLEQPKKKRRRSNSFVDDKELARRRNETKQLHSIIEKRRRIKINREFEALKYIIPACRNSENNNKKSTSSNTNNSKIDGMYKLTILKSSVEYILYLHHIIQRQHQLLSKALPEYSYDIGYTEIPIDVNQYRNIDREFKFSDLNASALKSSSSNSSSFGDIPEDVRGESAAELRDGLLSREGELTDQAFEEDQLPSPDRTPDIGPVFSLRAPGSYDPRYALQPQSQSQILFENYSSVSQAEQASRYSNSGIKSGSLSSATSPFTVPVKSNAKKGSFFLPDPAIPTGTSLSARDEPKTSVPDADSLPKRMYFKSRVPANNLTAEIGSASDEDDYQAREERGLEDASKLLLSLRKPSIEKLLN